MPFTFNTSNIIEVLLSTKALPVYAFILAALGYGAGQWNQSVEEAPQPVINVSAIEVPDWEVVGQYLQDDGRYQVQVFRRVDVPGIPGALQQGDPK